MQGFLYLSPFTKYSQLKFACPSPWPLEWTKVKCKYVNQKLIHKFLFDGNRNASSTCHRDIRKSNKMQKIDLENEIRVKVGPAPFNWNYSILYCDFFFRIWATRHMFMKKVTYTHVFTHAHSKRVVLTIGKCAKQICVKTYTIKIYFKVFIKHLPGGERPCLCCQSQLHYFGESLVEISHISAEI